MSNHAPNHQARVVPLRRPADTRPPAVEPETARAPSPERGGGGPGTAAGADAGAGREPLWRQVVGGVLRRERLAQERTLKDVAEAARISMPYLSEVERGLKEASSEVLAAAAQALGLRLTDLLVLVHGEIVRLASVRDGERAAAERRRTGRPTVVSSVTELHSASRRQPAAGRSASRPGDVRLAA